MITRDDQYNPSLAMQVTMEMVEKDKVFALLNTSGPQSHDAVAPYLIENKVPSWWPWSGNPKYFYQTRPFLFSGFPGPDQQQMFAVGESILSLDPDAKIVLVDYASTYGEDHFEGLQYAVQKGGQGEVTSISFDPMTADLTPQAVEAAAAKPDWVIYSGHETGCLSLTRALRQVAGYKGNIFELASPNYTGPNSELLDGMYKNLPSAKDGTTAPNDPAVIAVKKLLEEEGVRYHSAFSYTMFTIVETFVRALEIAGPDLTREGLVEAIYLAFDGTWTCALCKEFAFIFTPEDRYGDTISQLACWSDAKQEYEILGPAREYETSKGTGVIGNMPGFECQPPSADHPQGTCPWKSQ